MPGTSTAITLTHQVTYVEVEEKSDDDLTQCLVQLSTLPVAVREIFSIINYPPKKLASISIYQVCYGVGTDGKTAHNDAARWLFCNFFHQRNFKEIIWFIAHTHIKSNLFDFLGMHWIISKWWRKGALEAKSRPPRLVAFRNNEIITIAFLLVTNKFTKHFFPGTFYNDNQRIEVINGKWSHATWQELKIVLKVYVLERKKEFLNLYINCLNSLYIVLACTVRPNPRHVSFWIIIRM